MDYTISKVDNQNDDSTNASMSAEDSKIKYCESNDKNCTFEILKEKKEELKTKEGILNTNSKKIDNNAVRTGEIIVTSVLESEEHKCLKGVKINLYKINGLSPVLIKSKITDENGNAIFSELGEGCYRIIEIVDKRYFEKPKYINWNEIIIDSINNNQKVVVINKIKRLLAQDKHKNCM